MTTHRVTMTSKRVTTTWLKRLGVLGFYFFLIKGLAWVAAPLIFYWLV